MLPYVFDPLPLELSAELSPLTAHARLSTEDSEALADGSSSPQSLRPAESGVASALQSMRTLNEPPSLGSDEARTSATRIYRAKMEASLPQTLAARVPAAGVHGSLKPMTSLNRVRLETHADAHADAPAHETGKGERSSAQRFAARQFEPGESGTDAGLFSSGKAKSPANAAIDEPREVSRSLRSRFEQDNVLPARLSAPPAAPTIEVHIGRIDVRAPSTTPRSGAAASNTALHAGSLAAHLWSRSRGSRS